MLNLLQTNEIKSYTFTYNNDQINLKITEIDTLGNNFIKTKFHIMVVSEHIIKKTWKELFDCHNETYDRIYFLMSSHSVTPKLRLARCNYQLNKNKIHWLMVNAQC